MYDRTVLVHNDLHLPIFWNVYHAKRERDIFCLIS